MSCADDLLGIGERAVVKLACTSYGARAGAVLVDRGSPVLMTALYNALQAIISAAVGVRYIAPYLGRMGDAGRPAHEEITRMARARRGVRSGTEILVASLGTPDDVVLLAQEGVSHFALSPTVAKSFLTEPLTDDDAVMFDEAVRDMQHDAGVPHTH